MTIFDWTIVCFYSALVVVLGYIVGKKQQNQDDYYIASQNASSWLIGTSLAANQVSAISLIGVPAFIAAKHNGGLVWLQYELALPLSMIFIILIVIPAFRSYQGFSIYQWLQIRFGLHTQVVLAIIFLLSRSLATGIAILATSYVVSVLLEINIYLAIVFISFISLVYTSIGGILADIYTDIIQLIVLIFSTVIFCLIIVYLINGHDISVVDYTRFKVFNINSFGLKDGNTFSIAPMLLGGFFLYISYYGFDQSQAQRFLSCRSIAQAQDATIINTVLRFFIVFLYSLLGVLLLLLLSADSSFKMLMHKQPPDVLVPSFIKQYIPTGLKGIVVSGILAASMSSVDSAINSLSAITYNDVIALVYRKITHLSASAKLLFSRILTIVWGIITTIFAIIFAGSSETVVELVNKIGSLLYGPISAVFVVGLLTKRKIPQNVIISGLFAGIMANIWVWQCLPGVSWMWWNAIGFFASFVIPLGYVLSVHTDTIDTQIVALIYESKTQVRVFMCLIWFICIVIIFMAIEKLLT